MSGSEIPAGGDPMPVRGVEEVLADLRAIVEAARPVPLSASAVVPREELLALIDEAADVLPREVRAARWLLKEREEFRHRAEREAEDIVAAARARAEQLVQRTEVVKAAERRAREIIDEAEAASRRMRRETEDYCDQRLASFEIVLERTLRVVRAGREKLQVTPLEPEEPDEAAAVANEFFDQDRDDA